MLQIKQVWHPLHRRHFLEKSLQKANDCKRAFYLYHQGLESEVCCFINYFHVF